MKGSGIIRRLIITVQAWTRRLWTNVGLTAKMGIMVAVGLTALMAIFGYLGVSEMETSTRQTLQERVTLAQLAAGHLDSVLTHVERMMTSAASYRSSTGEQRDEMGFGPAELRAAFYQLSPFSRQVFLLNTQGEIVLTEPSTPTPDTASMTSVPSIVETLQTGRFTLSGPVHVAAGQDPAVLASVPIHGSGGLISGVLAASLDLSSPELSAFLQPVSLGNTGYMEVVNDTGVILLSTRPDRLLQQSDHNANLSTLIREGQALVATCHDCHQVSNGGQPLPEVMAFAPLTKVGWGVVVRQHENETFAAARRLQGRILLLGTVAVLGALVLVWMTTRSVIAPVQLLTGAAQRIAQGDLSTPICCERGDEIGDLAEAFDDMRIRLHTSMEEIQAWNRELDRRVRERTQACVAAQQEAQQARDYLQAIIDGLSDELVVVDRDFRVRQANAVVLQRWGQQGRVIGQPCQAVVHRGSPCRPPNCTCPVQEVMDTGQPVRATHFHSNAQGEGRYVTIVASPLRDQDGEITEVIELLRDVTEEKRLEHALLQRNEELSALNVVAATVSQSLDLQEILDTALDKILELTGVDVGAIFLVDEKDGDLELMAHRGLSPDAAAVAARLGLTDGSCGGVLELSQPVIVPDAGRYGGTRGASLRREGLRALVHVPLVAKGAALGSMCVGARQPHDFEDEEVGLLSAFGHQIAMATENARLYAEVQRKEQMRGELLKKVINAQEEERKRIARGLHDETSQALTAVLYSLDATQDTDDVGEVKAILGRARDLTVQTLEEVHKLILDLRPTMLDHLGLVSAVRWLAETRLEHTGVRVQLEEEGTSHRLPSEVETVLFRVVQEALTNIARHAGARNARIRFDFQDGHVAIAVEDDGIGFDVDEVMRSKDVRRGLGLLGMQERITLLGGDFTIFSRPGEGTTVLIKAPVSEEGSNGR